MKAVAKRAWWVFGLALHGCLVSEINAYPLRIGAAQVSITPPIGIPMAGYYHERGASSIHDQLYARTIVLEKDGVKAAIVSLDLITTRRSFVQDARRLIEASTDIPGDHVMISATHAHTGPVLASESTLDEARGGKDELVLQYSRTLPAFIADSVVKANAQLQEAQAQGAIGVEDSIAFNRRFHMKDGTVGWNPGKQNADIIKAAGPIDPEVPFVFFSNTEGAALATYVNYAVHLDNVGGLEISADLPFALSETLKRYHGKEMVTVYTTGACGDVNHVNVAWGAPQKGHDNATRMGVILAGEVLSQWPVLKAVDGSLKVRSEIVELSLPDVTSEDIDSSKDVIQTADDRTRASFMKLVQAHKVLDVAARNGKPWEVEVQVITLGDQLAWVALPGEIFVQLGLDLKLDSPYPQTMIAELANGSIGYIPNMRAYPQGNYEVVSARCAAGSGEKLIATAIRLLKDSHRKSP
jgi:hypothetical protein